MDGSDQFQPKAGEKTALEGIERSAGRSVTIATGMACLTIHFSGTQSSRNSLEIHQRHREMHAAQRELAAKRKAASPQNPNKF